MHRNSAHMRTVRNSQRLLCACGDGTDPNGIWKLSLPCKKFAGVKLFKVGMMGCHLTGKEAWEVVGMRNEIIRVIGARRRTKRNAEEAKPMELFTAHIFRCTYAMSIRCVHPAIVRSSFDIHLNPHRI